MSESKRKKPRKRKLPDDIMERPDREVMTILFGKRVMKELDKMTEHDEEVPPKNHTGG